MVMVVLQERSSVLVAPLLVGWRLEFLMAVIVGILVVDSLTRMVDFLLLASSTGCSSSSSICSCHMHNPEAACWLD
jgi:hypothetical protein